MMFSIRIYLVEMYTYKRYMYIWYLKVIEKIAFFFFVLFFF